MLNLHEKANIGDFAPYFFGELIKRQFPPSAALST